MDIPRIHAISGKHKAFSEGVVNPYTYCGEFYDVNSNMYYLRNRYYNPRIGRFTSIDPVKDGSNWYVYCGNNPINRIDPNGTSAYDLFNSLDELLIDWAWNYADVSFTMHREVGSTIYSIGVGENIQFGYTNALVGEHTSLNFADTLFMVPNGANAFSYVHTHTIREYGYYEGLSSADMQVVDKNNNEYGDLYKSGFAVTNRGKNVAIYGYGLFVTEINSYVDWNDEKNKNPNYAEQFDTLLYEDIQYKQLSYERKTDVLGRYPLSKNFGYQTWRKRRK